MAAVLDLKQWSGNVKQYVRDIGLMDKAEAASAAASKQVAKARDAATRSIDRARQSIKGFDLNKVMPEGIANKVTNFSGKIGEMANKFGDLPGPIGQAASSLSGMIGPLTASTAGLGLIVVAAGAAAVAFLALGQRGAAFRGVIEAFDITSRRAGTTAHILLGDLRTAARGTVSDMALMRQANVALAGASRQVAEALGQNGGLAGLMEIARAQAKATGQDVDFLFQSLVTGIKRSSPPLIDNTGLVLSIGEANAAYAASIGKTVDQLTAEEKQIALLNATLAAGKMAVDSYGQGQLTAAERMAQMNTTITNLMDGLAMAVQPLYELLLAVGNTILNVIAWPLQNIVIPIFYELNNLIFGNMIRAWESFTGLLQDLVGPTLNSLKKWIALVIAAIRGMGIILRWIVGGIGNMLKPVRDLLVRVAEAIGNFLDPAEFARRAGSAFAAFADGIMWAANNLIFPAVIGIAEFIRDFLMGFSPPKRGPLSNIDKGGSNVMSAWLDGFTGVPLTPVSSMAQNVDDMLGSIGKMSHSQVEARLAQLDAALQPFIDNLEVAKARMEAVVAPLKEAQEILSKRVTSAAKKFFGGEMSADEMRALDAQNQQLTDRLALFEGMTAEAEYQLAMARSQQAMERALLNIQLRRTESSEKASKARGKTDKAGQRTADTGADTGAGGGGEGDPATGSAGGGMGDFGINPDAAGDWLADMDVWGTAKEVGGAFVDGFMSDLDSGELAKFGENSEKLRGIFGEIGESNLVTKISDMFEGVFGDGEDSVRTKISTFVEDVRKWFTEDLPGIFDGFSLSSLTSGFTDAIGSISSLILGGGGRDQTFSLKSIVEGIPDTIKNGIGDLLEPLTNVLKTPFSDVIQGIYDLIFSDSSVSSLKMTLSGILGNLTTWIGSLTEPVTSAMKQPFDDVVGAIDRLISGSEEGDLSLKGIIDGIPTFIAEAMALVKGTFNRFFDSEQGVIRELWDGFIELASSVFKPEAGGLLYDVLVKVGGALVDTLAQPIENIINTILDGIASGLQVGIDVINDLISGANYLPGVKIEKIGDIGDYLHVDIVGSIPGAARGGLLGPGLAQVHKGEVLVNSASPYMVFPREWVEALRGIRDELRRGPAHYRPVPQPPVVAPVIQGGNQGGVNVTQHFNGHADSGSVRRAWMELQAMGAVG